MWEEFSALCLAAVVCVALPACSSTSSTTNNDRTSRSLYGELGGVDGLRPIVDEWVWRLATDDIIGPTLAESELGSIKEQTLVFVCAVAGGPCLDSGDRPLIPFSGSPSAAARRVVSHLRGAALARGARADTVERLVEQIEQDVRAFIGPPRG